MKRVRQVIQRGTLVIGLLVLLIPIFEFNSIRSNWMVVLGAIPVLAFHAYYLLQVNSDYITLLHIVGLGIGFLFGFPVSIFSTAVGIVGGQLTRLVSEKRFTPERVLDRTLWMGIGCQLGIHLVPLAWVWAGSRWLGLEARSMLAEPLQSLPLAVGLVGFIFIYLFFFVINILAGKEKPGAFFPRTLISLGLVNTLPLPFIIIIVHTYLAAPVQALVILLSSLTIIQVLLYRLGRYRSQVDRQIEELSTLNQVSRSLQSTLDLNQLLPIIHREVTRFLEIDNFYVALYDRDQQELWYPLAVKHNTRQDWPRRAIEDRLTDRVILEKTPILLSPGFQQEAEYLGLPSSAETPRAWMGVPLISSERALGCLAVMDFSDKTIFSSADLDLLNTLSGQVSVAIENALLYKGIQKRAAHLESLNQLSRVITSSLDLEIVLAQSCQAVQEVEEGAGSAVYLWDERREQATLAYANQLSDEFLVGTRGHFLFSSPDGENNPVDRVRFVEDIDSLSLPEDVLNIYRKEGIRAAAFIPLVTVEGPVGYLQVYYHQVRSLDRDRMNLLMNFASQSAMAVSNARLYARTDEALTHRVQQLSLLEQISRELSAELDLSRLFTLILQSALRLTRADMGAVLLLDPCTKELQIKVFQGYTGPFPDKPHLVGIVGRVLRTKQAQNIPDVRQDEDYYDLTGGKTISQLSVPMLHDQRLLGIINLESDHPDAFSESDLTFITQLADQSSIALINAELYQETQERLWEQTILYDFSRQIGGTLNAGALMKTILETMADVINPITGGIYRWNPPRARYELSSGVQLPDILAHLPEDISLLPDNRFSTAPIPNGQKRDCCRGCRCLTLSLDAAGEPLALAVFHIPAARELSDQEIKLLETMAVQGAITLQSARHFTGATQERDRLDAVLDSVDEAIMMITGDGTVLMANTLLQTFSGVELERILNSPITDLPDQVLNILGHDVEGVICLKDIPMIKAGPWPKKETYPGQGRHADRYYERGVFPVGGDSNNLQGIVVVIRDITEQIQIQQERELISETLVHDLRSPASAVLGSIDLISEVLGEGEVDDIAAQSLAIARRGTNRILDLIESILEISRMETGSFELSLQDRDINQVTRELISDSIPRANQAGIILQGQLGKDLPEVRLDGDKIRRVIANLLDNALKFTPEGGKVILTTARVEDGVEIQVRDTGSGVPEEYREKIFDRFVQVPGQWSRARGSGLGLTFCRLVVEAHGGSIRVDNHPGGGSVFSFVLPVSPPDVDLEG